jgi:hypothetical protein
MLPEIIDCYGECSSIGLLGDGECNYQFNCDAFEGDDGDCWEAAEDAGSSGWESEPDATPSEPDAAPSAPDAAMGYDDGYVTDCYGECSPGWYLANDDCNSALDCALFEYDYGDCSSTEPTPDAQAPWEDTMPEADTSGPGECDATQVIGCDGTSCKPESWLNDDYCDWSLNCAQYDYDLGDCP